MQQLNKKVIDLDGDIPMQKLLELQKKLKNKETVETVKSTFITSKETKLIKEGVPTATLQAKNQQTFNTFSQNFPSNVPKANERPKQKQ